MLLLKIKKLKAFTLVELIIVITILAILATIAFVSFQSYTKSARDGNKVTTLRSIQQGLMSYQIKTGTYPDPDNILDIIGINYQGYVGENVSKQIKIGQSNSAQNVSNTYLYSLSRNKLKHELGVYLEERNSTYFSLLPSLYADTGDYEKQYLYTIGDLVGLVIEPNTNAPVQEIYTGSLNLTTNTGTFLVQFSNTVSNSGIISGSGSNFITQIQTIQTYTGSTGGEGGGGGGINYTVSGNITNGSGADISICGTNIIADSSGNFSLSIAANTNCNNLVITKTNYTCTVGMNGPLSLTTNFTTVAGNCNSSMTYMTISTNTKEFNLYTYLGNPTTPINMEVTINAGIYLWSSNTSIPAFNTGNLPPGSNVILINNGYIMGKGGNGGGDGQNGFPGGPAINLGANISINNTNGFIGGGGGGGGSGGGGSAGGGGGAGGGNGGASFLTAGGVGGSIGNIGSNGIYTDDGMQSWISGGGGGRVFPGTSGAGTFGGGAGGGGGYIDSGAGGAGGSGNNIGSPGNPNTYWNGGGGGGGWGASGGAGKGYAYADRPGGAGGKSIVLNGYSVTWLSGTSQVYGLVN